MSFHGAGEIERSLEVAAERGGDLSQAIYARLYKAFPETEPLFALDRDGGVRGAMMAHVFETIFDFIGERRYAHKFIQCEIVTHEGYGVPREAFAAFFAIVGDEVRDACAEEWTDAMAHAWKSLLKDLSRYVTAS